LCRQLSRLNFGLWPDVRERKNGSTEISCDIDTLSSPLKRDGSEPPVKPLRPVAA
jgi:hypothetical protein